MANLRAVLQDQEPRRLVDEDPDQHSHPLFRQSPGTKMQGARGREGINTTEDGARDSQEMSDNYSVKEQGGHFQRSGDRTENHQSSRPKGGRRMEGDRRGSPGQGPDTKTEAGNCPGEQDRATPDQHRHHKSGRRKRGPKEPQFRSRSHARASTSAAPLLNTRMTASTSQRRHGATARVRPTHGTRHRRHREPGPAPSCPGIRSQKETEIDDPTTLLPGTNKNGTHRQTMRRPKQARKT